MIAALGKMQIALRAARAAYEFSAGSYTYSALNAVIDAHNEMINVIGNPEEVNDDPERD